MNLSVIWKLQDLMTPVMSKVSKTAVDAQRVIERVNTRTANAFKKTRDSADSLNDKISFLEKYRNKLIIGVDDRDIRRANEGIARLNSQLDKVDQKNKRQQGLLGGFGGMKGMVAGLGLYHAGSAGMDALTRGMGIEQAEESFKYFTGSVEKAQGIIKQLEGFSKTYSMYKKVDLMRGAEVIADTFGADNVMKLTTATAKLAKGNTENYMGILTRLQQIKGTGYLQGDELMELLNRGVFGLQAEIARVKGISSAQFEKLKTAQKISYEDVEAALIRMTSAGGKYDKILDVVAKTSFGKWETIKNIVSTKSAEMGKDVMQGLSGAMDWVVRFLNNTAPITTAMSRLGVAFKPILNSIYRLLVAFGLISSKGDSVTNVVNTIAKVTNTAAWIIERLGATISWVIGIFEAFPFLKYVAGFLAINHAVRSIDFLQKGNMLLSFISKFNLIPVAVSAINTLTGAFRLLSTGMQFLWANPIGLIVLGVMALAGAVYYAWNNFEGFRRVVIQTWEGFKFLFSGAVELVQAAWAKIQPVFTTIGQYWRFVMTLIGTYVRIAWAIVSDRFNAIKETVSGVFTTLKGIVSGFWDWFVDKALKAIRLTAAIMTLGLSEVGIAGFNKFKTGYDRGAAVADKYEAARKAQEKAAPKKEGLFSKLSTPDFNMPAFSGGNAAGLGAGIGKATGITDAVNGSASKNVTINLNSKIADIYNTFSGSESPEDQAKKITDGVLMELNRILMTGNRLALE
jgi:hypothetical protein